MKTKNLLLVPALIAVLNLLPAGRAAAQTYTVLKNFSGTNGWGPYGGLVSSGSTLYGTTANGGSPYDGVHFGYGTLFKVNTDGSGFTVLRNFGGGDGAGSTTGLVLSGGTLYGAAGKTLFKVNTDGSGFTILWNLDQGSGANLVLADGTLYGTTINGGTIGGGTIFKINTDGNGYAVLRNFTGSDGIEPVGLVLSGSTLYGTAWEGGSSGHGTVFKVNTNGTGFAVLKNFSAFVVNGETNSDGAYPTTVLALSGSTLYGTTYSGGSSAIGTVFKLNTSGSGFTVLKNSGAAGPSARTGLVLSGSTLYGTTWSSGSGTVFKIKTDGSGYAVLKNFSGSDGSEPYAGVVLSGNTLYGTTTTGGSFGKGVVFSLSLSPLLNYTPQAGQLVLSWNDPTFALQTAPAITGTFTNLPGATSPYTNALTGAQQYFRLISN